MFKSEMACGSEKNYCTFKGRAPDFLKRGLHHSDGEMNMHKLGVEPTTLTLFPHAYMAFLQITSEKGFYILSIYRGYGKSKTAQCPAN